jgi:hypothetical protein
MLDRDNLILLLDRCRAMRDQYPPEHNQHDAIARQIADLQDRINAIDAKKTTEKNMVVC